MNKKFVVIMSLFLITSFGFAKEAFVKARICPYFQEANMSSTKIGALNHNDEVEVIEVKGDWSFIKINGVSGYVKNMFLGDAPGVRVSSVADSKTDLSSVEIRKRASNFTSSAAAVRGLSSESVRDRENLSFKDYDFESIKWVENTFSFTEEELVAFSEVEFINF